MLRMSNLKQRGIPRESGKAGYTYAIVAWFGLIPFILMFIVPLALYGGRLNVSTVDGTYRLGTSDLLHALLVLGSWLVIVIVFAGLGMRIFSKKRDVAYWPQARLERVFLYLSILGGAVFVVHQLLIFPPALENFVHFASMSAYWALGLGVCLVFSPRQETGGVWGYRVLTATLFLVLTLIPIVLGNANSVASAGVVIVVALYIVGARTSTKMAAILLAGILVAVGMTLKTTLRQVLHEGGVYQRQEVASSLLNKPRAEAVHKPRPVHHTAHHGLNKPRAEAVHKPPPFHHTAHHGLNKPRAEAVHKPCSFGGGPAENDNVLIKCAGVVADSLESDMNAFSSYDQNLGNIILPKELLGEHLHFSVARVVHRLNHLGLLGHVMVSTPDVVPSWGGATYKSLLFLAIPRAIWPDKPSVGVANLFGRQYGLLMPDDRATTVNVDPVTEAWMNGGWLAVLLSSAGIGLLFGGVMGWLSRGGDQHIRFLAAITVALHVALFESETALIIGGLVQGLLFLGAIVVAVWLLNRGHRFLFPARAS